MFGEISVNCYLDDLVILISLDGCKFLRVLLGLQERSQRKEHVTKNTAPAGINALRTRDLPEEGYSVGSSLACFLRDLTKMNAMIAAIAAAATAQGTQAVLTTGA